MKLRIQGNSVRLRLTRPEVEQLATKGEVTAHAAFPGGRRLRYTVVSAEGQGKVRANFEDGAVVVTIPDRIVNEWAASEQVSIAGSQALEADGPLDILVEKDFACLAPREGEDQSQMFPHPREGTENC